MWTEKPVKPSIGSSLPRQFQIAGYNSKESQGEQERGIHWIQYPLHGAVLNLVSTQSVQYVQPALQSSLYDCCLIPLQKFQKIKHMMAVGKFFCCCPQ